MVPHRDRRSRTRRPDTYDAYLRLHLLSHRLVEPHGLNLDGIFGVLTNVVWDQSRTLPGRGFEHTRLRLRPRLQTGGTGSTSSRMVDYVVPTGCASPTPTRCGWAHLAPGTTVMHEGS